MTRGTLLVAVAVFLAAALLTRLVRQLALRRQLLDRPNERSSHVTPTPRAGGLAIVLCTLAGIAVLCFAGQVPARLGWAIAGGGIPVALAGLVDDVRSLSPGVRLVVHFISGLVSVLALGGLGPVQWGTTAVGLGAAGHVLAVLGVVWGINLFNFMDGIDGIAASEGSFAALGAALVALLCAIGSNGVTAAGSVFAAACLGFLVWNWPPARIFMGDVGSGFLGFVVSTLAIAQTHASPAGAWIWVTLCLVFVADATVTLLRRLLRGEHVHQAHRSHAYQWLARRWGTHLPVTLSVVGINVLWLFPCALLEARHPAQAGWIALVAAVPVILGVIGAGAGRAEIADHVTDA